MNKFFGMEASSDAIGSIRTMIENLENRFDNFISNEPDKTPRKSKYLSSIIARRIYKNRRKRDEIFRGFNIFGEPAWDIILDLYVAHCDGKEISVTSSCIAACAPNTTGLRWLSVLEDNGLLCRYPDISDKRRVHVRLTPEAIGMLDKYFS